MTDLASQKLIELLSEIEDALPNSELPIAYALEWIYPDGNEDIQEYGEGMNEDLCELTLEVIPFSEI